MGDRGDLAAEPVDETAIMASTIAAELVDALANAVSSLGLHGRAGSSHDEPVRVPVPT